MSSTKTVLHAYSTPDFEHELSWAGITIQDDGQVIIWWNVGQNGAWVKIDELREALAAIPD